MTGVLVRGRRGEPRQEMQRKKLEAEIGVMKPPDRECLESLEAGRGKKNSPLRPPGGAWPC